MNFFNVSVPYRTISGRRSKQFPRIKATGYNAAIKIAEEKMHNRRGVILIEGGTAVQVDA
jgi:hypothetical protein